MRILMVCLGNICRSPIAEGVLKHKANELGLSWQVDSAGTEPYHIGEAPHRFSQKVCLRNGIDISGQRARQFTASDFEKYDIIYAMADDVYREIKRIGGNKANMNRVAYFLNEVMPGSDASVPDPWYGGEDGFTEVFDLINKTCDVIADKYAQHK